MSGYRSKVTLKHKGFSPVSNPSRTANHPTTTRLGRNWAPRWYCPSPLVFVGRNIVRSLHTFWSLLQQAAWLLPHACSIGMATSVSPLDACLLCLETFRTYGRGRRGSSSLSRWRHQNCSKQVVGYCRISGKPLWRWLQLQKQRPGQGEKQSWRKACWLRVVL